MASLHKDDQSVANEAYSDTFEPSSSSSISTVGDLTGESESFASLLPSYNTPFTSVESDGTIKQSDNSYERGASIPDIDTGGRCPSSIAAGIFLDRKLELLRLHAQETSTPSVSVQTQARSVLGAHPVNEEESAYTEASLRRLRSVRDEGCTGIDCFKTKKESNEIFPVQYERLKMEALKHRVKLQIKRLTDECEEHYQTTTNCTECMEQQRSVAEREFVYHKINLLTQTDFGKKLEDHLYQKDSLSLLGDIVGSCIPPSAPSDDVWRALADKMMELKQTHHKEHPHATDV